MAENVKVIVRCRPMNKKERETGCKVSLLLVHEPISLMFSFQGDSTHGKLRDRNVGS